MRQIKDTAVGVLLILLVVFILYLLFSWFFGFFGSASDNVKAASITAIVSVSIFSIGRYFESKRESRQRINAEKIAVYKRFFDFYFDTFTYEKVHGKAMPEKKLLEDMIEFQKEVVFWGSDAVIREYLDFKDNLIKFSLGKNDKKEGIAEGLAPVFRSTGKLLTAMRRDIGYTFTSFSAVDLARLQLTEDEKTGASAVKKILGDNKN